MKLKPLLEVSKLTKNFSGICAVNHVSFNLTPGTITAVIGPNGAGKTTLYNLLSGQLTATSGSVKLEDKELTSLSPDQIVKAGVGRSFQITSIFPSLTVQQNIRAAVISEQKKQFNLWRNISRDTSLNQSVAEILQLISIEHLASTPVHSLSHGDQALVEIGIVLALKPRLILLDEPTAGMSSTETKRIVQLIRHLQQQISCTFLLTEHDMTVIFELAECLLVMHQGRIIAEGTPDEIRQDLAVRRAYLGNNL